MSRVSIDDTHLKNIANSIRTKKGTSNNIAPQNMSGEIDTIPVANLQASKTVTITSNGTQTITADTGYDGLESVEVNTNVAFDTSEFFTNTISNGGGYSPGFAKMIKTIPTNITVSGTSLANAFGTSALAEGNSITKIPLFDTSNVNNMEGMCQYCGNLTEIALLDTSNVTNMNYMFQYCTSLTTVPQFNTNMLEKAISMFKECTSLISVPQFNFRNFNNMGAMFQGCTSLTTVPQFNTSKVTNFNNVFTGCPNLTDESLNNILAMCINASSYTGTKTLVRLGFTSTNYSATRIQGLSNYQAFLDAGWTIGY